MSERRRAATPKAGRSLRPPVAAPAPMDIRELLAAPLAQSGIGQLAAIRRPARRLGVESVRQLLFHLPRRYDDLREMQTLGALRYLDDGTVASADVIVEEVSVEQTWRKRVQVANALLRDGTGIARATWYGRQFIERRIGPGDRILVSGRIKHRNGMVVFEGPDFQRADAVDLLHVGRIVPVYRLTAGLTAKRLRAAMRTALDAAGMQYPEYLPPAVIHEHQLPSIATTLEAAHYPSDFDARDDALRRLAFDELLALQLGMVGRRRARGRSTTEAVRLDPGGDARIRAAIVAAISRKLGRDVELTADQELAISEVEGDLARTTPMLRLIQGDVGSGKTAVAAWALAAAALAGRQGALLAPTDLLARQHAVTVGDLLADLGIPVVLLTGSLSAEGRRNAYEAIATGQAPVVVGTHAILVDKVAFADLGIAVVDEQHRFGVEQRGALEAKADQQPHVLLMTATPIPRTLGQVLYADLDVSTLRTPPAGRIAVRTGIRRPADLEGTWQRVRDEAALGHRTFVVVPRIGPAAPSSADDEAGWAGDEALPDEDLEETWAAAAEAEYERLTGHLAPLRVGLVHGRMKPADRDSVMAAFRDGDLDVLVGTTVVEVGVDVPEATLMVIEGAERFGLAQLHQLRGRVGRGTDASFCVLVSEAAEGTTEHERLKAVVSTSDGFELAEKDFELRREGDVLGLAQSGLPRLRVATLASQAHRELASRARADAETLLGDEATVEQRHPGLHAELVAGWLADVYQGDPASAA